MGRYCKVHRGPERVQVLEVNVPLIDKEVGASAYLVLVSKTIAVTRVEDSKGTQGILCRILLRQISPTMLQSSSKVCQRDLWQSTYHEGRDI